MKEQSLINEIGIGLIGVIIGSILAFLTTYIFFIRNRRIARYTEFKINIANLLGLIYEAKEHWFLIIEYFYLKKFELYISENDTSNGFKLNDGNFENYRIKMISLYSDILKSVEVIKSFQLKYGVRIKRKILALKLNGNKIPDHYISQKTLKKISLYAVSHLVNLRFNSEEELGGEFDKLIESLKSKLSEDEKRFEKISKPI